jgi:hypothetical protein
MSDLITCSSKVGLDNTKHPLLQFLRRNHDRLSYIVMVVKFERPAVTARGK